ncbi:MAG TPA: hypothetical protein VIX19_02770 [Terriglobales bacterium]
MLRRRFPIPASLSRRCCGWLIAATALVLAATAAAQENYEIQVYGSETVAPKTTMLELHSNFIVEGSREIDNGVLPTNHVLHETLEITQGFTPWFETGFYVFTVVGSGSWNWVGDHIRPRVRAPEQWHWPVGVSLSAEFGYQRPPYATGTWSLEIRPIVDQQKGRLYWSVNPAFDKGYTGLPSDRAWQFSPDAKVSWDFTKEVAFGLEYYSGFGPVAGLFSFREQSQQFIPAFDLNVSPRWEINFGVGFGVTAGTDHLLVKAIVGRRFNWGHSSSRTGKY